VSLTSINIRRLPFFQIGQKVGGFYGKRLIYGVALTAIAAAIATVPSHAQRANGGIWAAICKRSWTFPPDLTRSERRCRLIVLIAKGSFR